MCVYTVSPLVSACLIDGPRSAHENHDVASRYVAVSRESRTASFLHRGEFVDSLNPSCSSRLIESIETLRVSQVQHGSLIFQNHSVRRDSSRVSKFVSFGRFVDVIQFVSFREFIEFVEICEEHRNVSICFGNFNL